MAHREHRGEESRKAPYQSVSSKYGIDNNGKNTLLQNLSEVKSPYQTMSQDQDDNVRLRVHAPVESEVDTVKISRQNSSKFYTKSSNAGPQNNLYGEKKKKAVDVPVLDASGKQLPLVSHARDYNDKGGIPGSLGSGQELSRLLGSPGKLRFSTSQTYNVLTEQSKNMAKVDPTQKYQKFQPIVHIMKDLTVVDDDATTTTTTTTTTTSTISTDLENPVKKKKSRNNLKPSSPIKKPKNQDVDEIGITGSSSKEVEDISSKKQLSLQLPAVLDHATIPLTSTYIQTYHRVPNECEDAYLYTSRVSEKGEEEISKLLNKPQEREEARLDAIHAAASILDTVLLDQEDEEIGKRVAKKALDKLLQMQSYDANMDQRDTASLQKVSLSASLAEGWLARVAQQFSTYHAVPKQTTSSKYLDLLGLGGVDAVFPQAFSTIYAATAGIQSRFYELAKHGANNASFVRVLIDTYVSLLNNQDPEMTEWTYCCFHLHMLKKSHILLTASSHQLAHMTKENSSKYIYLTTRLHDQWNLTHKLALTRAKVVSLAYQVTSLNSTSDTLEPHLTVARAASSSWRSQERLTASDEVSMTRNQMQQKTKYKNTTETQYAALESRQEHIQIHQHLRRDIQHADVVSRDLEVRIGVLQYILDQIALEEESVRLEVFTIMKDEEYKKKKILTDSINQLEHINTKLVQICGDFISDKKFIGHILLHPQNRSKLLRVAMLNTIKAQQDTKNGTSSNNTSNNTDNTSVVTGSQTVPTPITLTSTSSHNNNTSNITTTHNAHFTLEHSVQKLEMKIQRVVHFQKRSIQQITVQQREQSEAQTQKDQLLVETLDFDQKSTSLRTIVDTLHEEGKAIEYVISQQQDQMKQVVSHRKQLESNIQQVEGQDLKCALLELQGSNERIGAQQQQQQEEKQETESILERTARLKEETSFQEQMYRTTSEQIEMQRVRNDYLGKTGNMEHSMLELVNTYKLRESQCQHELFEYNRFCELEEYELERLAAQKTTVLQQIQVTEKYVNKVTEIMQVVDDQQKLSEMERNRYTQELVASEEKLQGLQEKHTETHQIFLSRKLALQEQTEDLQKQISTHRTTCQTLRQEQKIVHHQVRDATIKNRQKLHSSTTVVEQLRTDVFATRKRVILLYDKAKQAYEEAQTVFGKKNAEQEEVQPQFDSLTIATKEMVVERLEYLRVKQALVTETRRVASVLASIRLLKKFLSGVSSAVETSNERITEVCTRLHTEVGLNLTIVGKTQQSRADTAYQACQRAQFAKKNIAIQAVAPVENVSVQTDPLTTMDIRGKRVEQKKKIVAMNFMGENEDTKTSTIIPSNTVKKGISVDESEDVSTCVHTEYPQLVQWLEQNNAGEDLPITVTVGTNERVAVTVPYTCYGSPMAFVQASVVSTLQTVFSSPLQRLENVMNHVHILGEEAELQEEQVLLRSGVFFDHLLQLSNSAVYSASKERNQILPEMLNTDSSCLTEQLLATAIAKRRERVIPEGYTTVHTGWNTFERQSQILQSLNAEEQLYFQYIQQHMVMDIIEDQYIYTMLAKHTASLFGGSASGKNITAALGYIHYILDLYTQQKRDRVKVPEEDIEDVEPTQVYGVDGKVGLLEQPQLDGAFKVLQTPRASPSGKPSELRPGVRMFVNNWSQGSLSTNSSSEKLPSSNNIHQLLELYSSPAFKKDIVGAIGSQQLPNKRRSKTNSNNKPKNSKEEHHQSSSTHHKKNHIHNHNNIPEYAYEYEQEDQSQNTHIYEGEHAHYNIDHYIHEDSGNKETRVLQHEDSSQEPSSHTLRDSMYGEEEMPDYDRGGSLSALPAPASHILDGMEDGGVLEQEQRQSWVQPGTEDNNDVWNQSSEDAQYTEGFASAFGKNQKSLLVNAQPHVPSVPSSPSHLTSASSYGNILKRLLHEQNAQPNVQNSVKMNIQMHSPQKTTTYLDNKEEVKDPSSKPTSSQSADNTHRNHIPPKKLSFQDQYIIVGNRLIKKPGNEHILTFLHTQSSILETQIDVQDRPQTVDITESRQKTLQTGQDAFNGVDVYRVPAKIDFREQTRSSHTTQRQPQPSPYSILPPPSANSNTNSRFSKLPPLHVLSQPRSKDTENTVRAVKTAVQRSVRGNNK